MSAFAVCSDAPIAGLDAQRFFERSRVVDPSNTPGAATMPESPSLLIATGNETYPILF
jgi:hypothetical protein